MSLKDAFALGQALEENNQLKTELSDIKATQPSTVEVHYPGKVFHYQCSKEAAEWLVAQFRNQEWIIAKILPTQM